MNPVVPLTARQLDRAVHDAAETAKIGECVSMHTLGHTFATHLLEQKVDIRVIQVMLGHKKLETSSTPAPDQPPNSGLRFSTKAATAS
jgi:site-specific recombinase XerD